MPATKPCFADSHKAAARDSAQRRGGQKSLLNYLPNGAGRESARVNPSYRQTEQSDVWQKRKSERAEGKRGICFINSNYMIQASFAKRNSQSKAKPCGFLDDATASAAQRAYWRNTLASN